MAPSGGWDEAIAKNLEAGFYNHSFCPVGPEGPAFCIWEVREGITAEEFQEFIDGPNGVNFGLGAWMNICREINVEMAGNPLTQESSEATGGSQQPRTEPRSPEGVIRRIVASNAPSLRFIEEGRLRSLAALQSPDRSQDSLKRCRAGRDAREADREC